VSLRLRVLAPGRLLVRATIDWRTRCGRGSRLRGTIVYGFYDIEGGRLSVPGHGSRRVAPGGVTATERWRLGLRFFESSGYRVRGVWRLRAVVRRRGVFLETCTLRRRFSGSFQSGPG
jgi:hypothetical protein